MEELTELAQAVEAMRRAQNDYFKNRCVENLQISKIKEKEVDTLVKNILHPEVKNQTSMF